MRRRQWVVVKLNEDQLESGSASIMFRPFAFGIPRQQIQVIHGFGVLIRALVGLDVHKGQ